MKTKLTRTLPLILLNAVILTLPRAQAADDPVAVARSVLKADRQAVVKDSLRLTADESEKFWPLYQEYRADMDKVGDGLTKLIHEYAMLYPDVPDDRAKQLLKDLSALEKQHASTRTAHLKKIGRVLPASKTLRFAQVESRLDLALRLELASTVPIVPLEGTIVGRTSEGAAYAEGVAGGVVVQTHKLTARVAAVDKATRKVTLVSPEGIKQTVKVGPEAINFDQIRVGDQLKIEATDELVVKMAEPGESVDTGSAAVVVLAPKGAKPGGLMAETTQATATVVAIDREKRTATLRFGDGSSKTLAVRSDVDLSKRRVGEQVVFRLTEMIALTVEKP
jgi:hypothetical protein